MSLLGMFWEKKNLEQGTTGKDFWPTPFNLQLQIPLGQLCDCRPQGQARRQEGLQPLDGK